MDFSSLEAFECTLEDGLFHIVLNRPDQGNVLGVQFCKEVDLILSEISERRDVRAVLISARGRFFSLGGDISMMSGERAALPGIIKTMTSPLHTGIVRLMTMNAPVVCAVQGKGAFGGAAAMVAAADIVVASREAKFGAAFTGIGFSCDSGSTVAITHRMGVSRAKRFLLLGETLTAAQAQETGLVDIVAEEDAVLNDALAIARKFAAGPTMAYGEIKRLFLGTSGRGAASQMEEEAQALARMGRTDDAWEGLRAFVEKRPATFKGN